ncbi:SDR family NAD(P)-dependent oxidoreductase [Marivirga atlantica]|uniref:SDR family NAD(P)-dependent oxidoreductase n=1 Tax=Marivirga atlantica TaxID=1548457 RepID=A0A937A7H0_9BACT|nr:SDR family NAD(P)-dependent oxidoreductase [Marivirga atlantica]MBL0765025.1 SDR family NAD(P)-dependent oxidoreductase [Marivirga atlantica]
MKSLFIITGASKGIGRGLAEKALEDKDHNVIGISRTHSIQNDQYTALTADLSNPSEAASLSEKLYSNKSNYDRIVLINNAGTLGDVNHMGNIDNSSISQLMDLNVSSPMILMNEFMKTLRDFSGEKIIINISSGAGKKAVDGWSGYCASKAALDMATRVAFDENKIEENHFKIFAVAPGVVDTQMQTQIRNTTKDSFSSVDRFISLKEDEQLSNEHEVAEKYFYILSHIDDFDEPLLDVRNL